MRIWIFNQYATTPDYPGGTRHYDLAKKMAERGHDITIFAAGFHYLLHREIRLAKGEYYRIEDCDGIRFVWVRTLPYARNNWRRLCNMIVFAFRAWRLGKQLPRLISDLPAPDVIIGSSVHLLAVLAAYWVARHHNSRFVMEVRDLWPQTLVDMRALSEANPLTWLLRQLESFLYRRAKRIIVLASGMADYIVGCGIEKGKIIWIPNGVDTDRFSVPMPSSGNHRRPFTIIYMGAHGQANALDVLLHAAKILQDKETSAFKFVFVGDGPQKCDLISQAQAMQLQNVEFRPAVAKENVPGVLAEADATVFVLHDAPIYRYGISLNKLFDYMAAAKPIVLAGNPANNPVAESQCGIIAPPRDPEGLAKAIGDLYDMTPAERQAMGERGRRYVEQHHNIAVLAQRLEICLANEAG